ncbi:hypothetical protein ASD46_23555 [Rhizobium sp. Root491]|uniref:hypothetical protein n=1 Tax=Rhizobium sp. Root491 TaxID=1736548 RepID=UPI0007152AAB|nr:hypothetical protein [Rhizobium sp. Root491]KQY50773.1 hypothetical protein ASD46_23555 [Rhizobium sp. Root491]
MLIAAQVRAADKDAQIASKEEHIARKDERIERLEKLALAAERGAPQCNRGSYMQPSAQRAYPSPAYGLAASSSSEYAMMRRQNFIRLNTETNIDP